jgi:CRISPR-associated protein Cmr3
MELLLEPSDVWLFRDGRPFSAGVDAHAHTRFPPPHTALQGALRAKVLARDGVDFDDYGRGVQKYPHAHTAQVAERIGWPRAGYGSQFRIRRGPFLVRRTDAGLEVLYPAPAALAGLPGRLGQLTPLDHAPFIANLDEGLRPLWWHGLGPVEAVGGWLTEAGLRDYLSNKAPDRKNALVAPQAIYAIEARFGFKRDAARNRPVDTFLYLVEFVRVQRGVGVWVQVDGLETPLTPWPPLETMGLGGEARAAHVTRLSAGAVPSLSRAITGTKRRFLLYFATPASFGNAWRPQDWNTYFVNGTVRLVAAAVREPEIAGGYYVHHGDHGPKPNQRYVPAGSVFFFEVTGGTPSLVPDPITQAGAEIGYGQVHTGEW